MVVDGNVGDCCWWWLVVVVVVVVGGWWWRLMVAGRNASNGTGGSGDIKIDCSCLLNGSAFAGPSFS